MRIVDGEATAKPSFLITIGTFGRPEWIELAKNRALPSAVEAIGAYERSLSLEEMNAVGRSKVLQSHGSTLAQARNITANAYGNSGWLIFLDADDELDSEYLIHMAETIKHLGDDRRAIIQPATLGVVDGVEDREPWVIPRKKSLTDGNHCVIGGAVNCGLFKHVGGFDEWAAWEDWHLWLKCEAAGARFVVAPNAIYKVHTNTSKTSRNQISAKAGQRLRRDILRDIESRRESLKGYPKSDE